VGGRVFSELLARLEKAERFRQRVREELAQTVREWALYPIVEGIQALCGFDQEHAAMVVAEIGDIRRFATAPQFTAYLGLTPSEASSGDAGARSPERATVWRARPLPASRSSQLCHPPALRRLAGADPRQGLGRPGEAVPTMP
jgi:transposase